ncbi:unnamed protein product [Rotaria sp. Silwood2]|nr:unnamed protein product [Rotaria sp. Silwood2]CAF2732373.1 unnamed protein product [Rotaria sp. Silwood2]CAF3146243.1 unnamed protein product [Rotaria sp. Silwood2]CAF4241498.1 unnamed protein product [Rotaria sp. Silwood2]CAF4308285.1 unnamed protein product [Rotaria sp. Silwood2]
MIAYYSENNNISINLIPNTNYSIEQALKQMPICNSKDRPRQRNLLTILHAWTHFANTHNIQYWIAYGTLVGYVQGQGLLPHDSDTDVLILAQDTQQLIPFSNVNFSSIYEIKVHPQWSSAGFANRSYFPLQRINFIAPNARFIHRTLRYHVDIWPIYDYHPAQSRNRTKTIKTLTEYSTSYTWISSPIEWTFPLKPCIFSSIKVWCPAMPEKLVTMLYGIKALNETDKICVNGTWI